MDITVKNQNTWRGFTIVLSQSGIPVDISTAVFTFEVQRSYCSTVILSLSSGAGITLTVPTDGQFVIDKLYIDEVPGTYQHKCKMFLSGNVDDIFDGVFTITD